MDLNLEYLRNMNFKYTCIYLFHKKEEQNKYVLMFAAFPEDAINFIYKKLNIETVFVKSIEKTTITMPNTEVVCKKISDFNTWFAAKNNKNIEKHKIGYFTKYTYFVEMTENEVENIEKIFEDYIIEIEQIEEMKVNAKKVIQSTLF